MLKEDIQPYRLFSSLDLAQLFSEENSLMPSLHWVGQFQNAHDNSQPWWTHCHASDLLHRANKPVPLPSILTWRIWCQILCCCGQSLIFPSPWMQHVRAIRNDVIRFLISGCNIIKLFPVLIRLKPLPCLFALPQPFATSATHSIEGFLLSTSHWSPCEYNHWLSTEAVEERKRCN